MAYNEEDYTFRLPKDLATLPVYKLVSCLSWTTSQSDFDHVASFLSDRYDELQSQLAALKSSHAQDDSASKSSYAQLQQENSVFKTSCDQLERDNSALKLTCVQLQNESSALKSSYAQLQQENSVLKAGCDKLERDNSALKFTCVQLENESSAIKSSKALLERDNSALESKCGVLVQENTNLSSELDSLKTSCMQLEPVKLKCGVLENEVEKLKSHLESVKSSYMQAAKEKAPVMELSSMKSTCSQLRKEISEMNSGEKSLTLENGRKITESMIKQIFSPYGEIVDIELIKDQSGKSKGLCFVHYSKRESALDVIRQKNKIEMRGKKNGLDLSLDQNDLFFGNLKKEWSSQQVDHLIRQAFRDVVSVELAMAPVPKLPFGLKRCSNRGFAFVHFSSHEAAAYAHHAGSNPDFMLGGVLHPLIEWALPQAEFDLVEMAKTKIAFVGNLPPAANEEYLQKLFGPIGNVEKIAISKKSFRVIGFVHFATRIANSSLVAQLAAVYGNRDLERAIEEMNGRTVGAPDRGPPFKIKVAVLKTPATGNVRTCDGVIITRIKPLDMSNKRRDHSPEAPISKARRLDNVGTFGSPRISHILRIAAIRNSYGSQTYKELFGIAVVLANPLFQGIASLPPLVKERLLRVFRLRIATEHDICIYCLNGLKELPEASALSVLDEFLFSGADKYDKKSFFDSLIAEKRQRWYTSTSYPRQNDNSLWVPPNEERHHYFRSYRNSFSPAPVESQRIRYDSRAGQAYKFDPYYS